MKKNDINSYLDFRDHSETNDENKDFANFNLANNNENKSSCVKNYLEAKLDLF